MVLFGPTAVGKTELLFRLFQEKAEIISADSIQVYRYLDIGTAKPSRSLRKLLPHHMIDIVDPSEQFSTGEFVKLADRIATEVYSRGKLPVISGGTAFYIRNFIFGLPETPPGNSKIRKRLHKELEEDGIEPLYAELKRCDPVTAGRLSLSDHYRITRALEVFRLTGKPVSSFRVPFSFRKEYRFLILGIDRSRAELHDRINKRVDQMFLSGLYGEVKKLLSMGFSEKDPGLQGIGYREFLQMRRNGCTTLGEVKDQIKRDSRQYAKRQLTFFKSISEVQWFHPEEIDKIEDEVRYFLR
ncbi:MAG: tRNA (adenosine(37)-N6)-dimethylallyltransferase MiaA [Spirochaetota bacterium]